MALTGMGPVVTQRARWQDAASAREGSPRACAALARSPYRTAALQAARGGRRAGSAGTLSYARPLARRCAAGCGDRAARPAKGADAIREAGRRAASLAQRRGRAFSEALFDQGEDVTGFEDDPITDVRIGWAGGPLPREWEKELGRQLGSLLQHQTEGPAKRLASQLEDEEAQRRKQRSQDAVKAWTMKKDAEARHAAMAENPVAADQGQLESGGRPRYTPEERDKHYVAWCGRYDRAQGFLRSWSPGNPHER